MYLDGKYDDIRRDPISSDGNDVIMKCDFSISCNVYFGEWRIELIVFFIFVLFVVVWLSVSVQSIATSY